MLGQLTRKIWPDGDYEAYSYYPDGNLWRQHLPVAAGESSANSYNQFSYDLMGRLVSEAYADNTQYSYVYDERGLLSEVHAGLIPSENSLLQDYDYDSLGRPLSVLHAETLQRISYAYDARGNRSLMSTQIGTDYQSYVSYSYDSLNRLVSLNDYDASLSDPTTDSQPENTLFDYNNLGLLSSIQRPNEVNTSYSYGAGASNPYWLTGIQHRDSDQGNLLLQGYAYSYDNLGNRVGMVESDASGVTGSYVYGYDAANRLISESLDGTTSDIRRYSYDRAGNRLSERYLSQTSNYSYNASDELTRITLHNGNYQDFRYFAGGNLEKQFGTLGIADYAYNSQSQLSSFSSGAIDISYGYDHEGHRVSQADNGVTTNYLWDEFSQYGDVILETNAFNERLGHYTLADGMLISQSFGVGATAETFYFLTDAQNSTRALSNADGTIEESYSYDAFGNLNGEDSLLTKYLYTGQQYDYQTDLYSLRARYYDPSIGRFTSRDTWAYNYGNPFELNRYGYAANNPLRYIDPSGFMAEYDASNHPNKSVATSQTNGSGWQIFQEAGKRTMYRDSFFSAVPAANSTSIFSLIGAVVSIGFVILIAAILMPIPVPSPFQPVPVTPALPAPTPAPVEPTPSTSPTPSNPPVDQMPIPSPAPSPSPNPTPGSQPSPAPSPSPSPRPVPPTNSPRRSGNCNTSGSQTLSAVQANTLIGRIAHTEIQFYFRTQFPTGSITNYHIPQGGRRGGPGFADAVLLDEGIRWGHLPNDNYAGIYEIKPDTMRNVASAQRQRNRYIANFHRTRQGGQAAAGTYWRPINEFVGPWPLDSRQGLYITTYYHQRNYEGLVFYYCQ